MSAVIKPNGWLASLQLGFEHRDSRTVLGHRRHIGPLAVQKPFYPEQEVCHVYLLHPPGGVVGGDQLSITVDVGEHAHALITTPAAGKFYRSSGAIACLQQDLKVAKQGTLEWLPQETIFFSGCNAKLATKVSLAPGSRFIGWEILCLGRPAAKEKFSNGICNQAFEIWSGEQALMVERMHIEGGGEILSAPWGLSGNTSVGTMVATPADEAMLIAIRQAGLEHEHELFSATLLDKVLICRCLASQAQTVRNMFIKVWQIIRPMLLERPACPPRIWWT